MKDLYLYEGTNVLINKFNIKNNDELEKQEGQVFALMSLNILNNGFSIESVFDIKKLHYMLFEKLYAWAGQNRKINMYKEEPVLDGLSVTYSNYQDIDNDLKALDKEFLSIDWKSLKKKELIDKLVIIISKLWRIHCFREGNTRTVSVFMYLLMKKYGLKVDVGMLHKHAKYYRNSLVMASIDEYSEYQYLTEILLDSVSFKSDIENKYKTIRDYEVEKYEYREHKYKD